MAKDKIADYDGATAGNNTDIGGISIAEGMLPSAVNNSMRELTRQLGAFADGTEGIDVLNLHDDDASASIKIQAPATVTTTTTFTLPDGDGTNGYALVTNGAGQLSWASAGGIANIVEDTTPQLGGNLDTNGNDINFGDNDKAVFGAGSDLQIYHNGSNSYIREVGAGNLYIEGSSAIHIRGTNTEFLASFGENSATTLYYDGSSKLATTATGADITGTLTADGLTVDGASVFNQAASDQSGGAAVKANGTAYGTNKSIHAYMNTSSASKSLIYAENGAGSVFNVDGAGDISFYDSTGVTQGFFWDASTQNLGLGTTSPSYGITLEGTGAKSSIRVGDTTNSVNVDVRANSTGGLVRTASNHPLVFATNQTERMRITSAGSVGIGTAAPSRPLEISSSENVLARFTSTDAVAAIEFVEPSSGGGQMYIGANGSAFTITTGGSEAARFDSSGNFLLGKSTASGANTEGVELRPTLSTFTSDGGTAIYASRLTNDGNVIAFERSSSSVGSISVTTSGTTYNTTSDLRLKENIEPLEATDKLMAMNPVSYNWKADPDGPRSMGFIAQEMQEVMPEAVSAGDDDDAMMSMDYGRITPILVSALQDAHRKIEELAAEIAELKGAK